MHKSVCLGMTLSLGLGGIVAGVMVEPSGVRAQGEPVWLSSYGAAQSAARQAGKPIFLVFR